MKDILDFIATLVHIDITYERIPLDSEDKNKIQNWFMAIGMTYVLMVPFLYFALNYGRNGIYDTGMMEILIYIGIILVIGLAINIFCLVFSVFQSQEDIDRKKLRNNGKK